MLDSKYNQVTGIPVKCGRMSVDGYYKHVATVKKCEEEEALASPPTVSLQ